MKISGHPTRINPEEIGRAVAAAITGVLKQGVTRRGFESDVTEQPNGNDSAAADDGAVSALHLVVARAVIEECGERNFLLDPSLPT